MSSGVTICGVCQGSDKPQLPAAYISIVSTAVSPIQPNVEEYLPLARMLAQQVHRRLPAGASLEDLESDAFYGLAQAARSYDPARGTTFRTYAANCIRNALATGLRQRQGIEQPVSLDATGEDRRPRCEQIASDQPGPEQATEVRDQVEHLLAHLKGRQLAVAQGLLRGLTKSQIAAELGVAPPAISRVMDQIRRIATDLGLDND